MNIPSVYDDIRPFEPDELQDVYKRLLDNEQFRQVLAYLYPGVPAEAIGAKMMQCKTNLEFQLAFLRTLWQRQVGDGIWTRPMLM